MTSSVLNCFYIVLCEDGIMIWRLVYQYVRHSVILSLHKLIL